jgi:peptidoglycan/xylan/chitin deacetylase (PgdA/CDA1 family)
MKVEYMQPLVSSIWQHPLPDLTSRIERCLAPAGMRSRGNGDARIFFRADDIAVPGSRFARLLEMFSRHRVPLALAVVPAWLTRPRWLALNKAGKKAASLWCWHQHGWRHANHERQGKKQEFGPARSRVQLEWDIRRGRRRLENLMGARFYPIFTPPWNRCGSDALQLLKALGYAAVSRSQASKTPSPPGLPDYFINVDLHTRKEKNPAAGWQNLFAELHQAIASNYCGIMIHHRMMNDAAFDFMEILLKTLVKNHKLQPVHFRDLADPGTQPG